MTHSANDNLIRFCSSSAVQRPHIIVMEPDRRSVEFEGLDKLWDEAMPLIERACAVATFTISDARDHVERTWIVPIFVRDDNGDIVLVALSFQGEIPACGKVLMALVARESVWPIGQNAVVEVLVSMATDLQINNVVLRSPDPLPLAWEVIDAPGGECLLQRIGPPPKAEPDSEYAAMKALYGDW